MGLLGSATRCANPRTAVPDCQECQPKVSGLDGLSRSCLSSAHVFHRTAGPDRRDEAMGAREFGRLVDQAMTKQGMSQDRLAVLVGELPGGKVLNGKQVARIRVGERRLDPFLVGRLIDLLDLNAAEAWHAAGLWPPGLAPEDVRVISEQRGARQMAANRAASP